MQARSIHLSRFDEHLKGSTASWTFLLALLISLHFVEPLVGSSWILELAVSLVLAFTLLSASVFTGVRKTTFVLLCAFAAVWIISNLLAGFEIVIIVLLPSIRPVLGPPAMNLHV